MTTEPAREPVQLYDEQGRPSGTAPRSRVRAENLLHASTGVLVLDPAGRVYVHRRTTVKDVNPGLLDVAAGGVVDAGEDPTAAAHRELAEELGIGPVELRPLGVCRYTDAVADYWAHLFETTWDGPIRWQPEEVAWGGWMAPAALLERVAAAPREFVPDTVPLLRDRLEELAAADGPAT